MIDVIDHNHFGYEAQAGDAMRGAFDWEMYYKRIPIPPELQRADPSDPFEWVAAWGPDGEAVGDWGMCVSTGDAPGQLSLMKWNKTGGKGMQDIGERSDLQGIKNHKVARVHSPTF